MECSFQPNNSREPTHATADTIGIVEAGRRLGIGRTLSYDLAKRDEFPVPIIRVGTRLRVSTLALSRLLEARK
jgi:hypothetical protein